MAQDSKCPCGDQAEFTVTTEHAADNLCPRCTVNEVRHILPATVSVVAIPDEFEDEEPAPAPPAAQPA